MRQNKVIVICSGGMDSVTLLHYLNNNLFYNIVGVLSVDYGQKHKLELQKAKINCEQLKLEHQIIDLQSIKPLLKGSALTDDIKVPEGHYEEENMKSTVVANRNMIILSLATAYAISKGADLVAYGAHSGDHFIYWDCRPKFIKKLSAVTQLAEPKPVKIIAPFKKINKVGILKIGIKLGINYKNTLTCYNGKEIACGRCGSCQERLMAFKENGIEDPLEYETREIIKKI